MENLWLNSLMKCLEIGILYYSHNDTPLSVTSKFLSNRIIKLHLLDSLFIQYIVLLVGRK